jgi:HK97 gp10 family phage protein
MVAKNFWEVDFRGIEELEEKMKRIQGGAEQVINEVLHTDGVQLVMVDIQPEIPVSKWKNRVRNKKHARNVQNPQTSKKENLKFTIRPKRTFEYLKYPDLGIGTSQHNPAQHFMNKGLKKASPKIVDKLKGKLNDLINGG